MNRTREYPEVAWSRLVRMAQAKKPSSKASASSSPRSRRTYKAPALEKGLEILGCHVQVPAGGALRGPRAPGPELVRDLSPRGHRNLAFHIRQACTRTGATRSNKLRHVASLTMLRRPCTIQLTRFTNAS